MPILVLASYVHAHCLHVDRLPLCGESLHSNTIWSEHGGKGLNVALGTHRLGIRVETLLPLGTDVVAEGVLQLLQDEGLHSRWALKIGEKSGFGVGFVAPNGENFLAVYPGANALLRPEHIEKVFAALPKVEMVYGQFEIPEAAIMLAFRFARGQFTRTVLNPSPWRLPTPTLLALTDILVVNETEAALLFGQEVTGDFLPEQWLNYLPVWVKQLDWQGDLLVVTLGEQGCLALTQGTLIYQPAWSISAMDVTGAGDAFSAGLVLGLMKGFELEETLKLACACGALVASKQGVLQNLPTWDEVFLFVQTKNIPEATRISFASSLD